ncbi:Tat pathway signal sequence domain protein [Streptomyces sp. NPDC046862]|uniref:Tat pathway signal sequence domain protein n=1 Tax=Streptomyces sp. NPDC046862 TaxID=3154603 RepID=UPI0034559B52
MSGVGPVEPGEGTRAWDDAPDAGPSPIAAPPPRGRLARLYARRRRAVLTSATAVTLLAGGGYVYATRPQAPPPPPPPYPSQVIGFTYLGAQRTPATAPTRSFSFGVEVTTQSGPPITVTRVSQPYAALSLVSAPRPPFRTKAGSPRKIVITMHVVHCANAPRNAGLPFLDVTLRNTRAIEDHSFILGERYAHDLSEALRVACGSTPSSSPKP